RDRLVGVGGDHVEAHRAGGVLGDGGGGGDEHRGGGRVLGRGEGGGGGGGDLRGEEGILGVVDEGAELEVAAVERVGEALAVARDAVAAGAGLARLGRGG